MEKKNKSKIVQLWDKFIASEIIPMILCGMILLTMFSSLAALSMFSIKSILTMLGVI